MSFIFKHNSPYLGNIVAEAKNETEPTIKIKEVPGQSTKLLQLENESGTVIYSVDQAGASTVSSTIQAATSQHLVLNTQTDSKQVRINSRDFTQASGDSIGFQAKPAQTVASSGTIQGGQISPRVNSGIALSGSGSIIGLYVDAYLKGTAAGTIGGDVRALNLELVTDDAGTRTISGNVNFIRMRAAFSATTITGKFVPIRIETAETQTNSKNYDYILDITGSNALIWKDDYTTEVTTLSGAFKVRVNGQDRWVPLYSGAPVV